MPTLWVGMNRRIQASLSYQINPRVRWVATLWVAIRVAPPLWGSAFKHNPSPQLFIHPSLGGYLKSQQRCSTALSASTIAPNSELGSKEGDLSGTTKALVRPECLKDLVEMDQR
eukprot:811307-Rhodomonas_salina.1